MIDEIKEELYLYNFLRQVFLREPTRQLLYEIAQIELSEGEGDDSDGGLKLIVNETRSNIERIDAFTKELGLEFARLFIGPLNAPAIPYASFYLSENRSLMTDETIDVRKRYLEAGVAVKELYSIPDDHIGIELEFIYDLSRRITESSERGEREETSRLSRIKNEFVANHMVGWIPQFAENVMNATNADFFKGAAMMLKECISEAAPTLKNNC